LAGSLGGGAAGSAASDAGGTLPPGGLDALVNSPEYAPRGSRTMRPGVGGGGGLTGLGVGGGMNGLPASAMRGGPGGSGSGPMGSSSSSGAFLDPLGLAGLSDDLAGLHVGAPGAAPYATNSNGSAARAAAAAAGADPRRSAPPPPAASYDPYRSTFSA
jgi:hypothetical protein